MKEHEFIRIKQRLGCIWSDLMPTADSVNAWYDSLKNYPFDLADQAAIKYIEENHFRPTPADIIMLIKAAKAEQNRSYDKFVPQFETLPDGRQVRVIKCKRCNDTGLVTWRDDDQVMYGRPCTCAAALANYAAARPKEERREAHESN